MQSLQESIFMKKKKEHDKLRKAKLDIIEVLISKPLINIYINNDDLFQ